MKVTSNLPDDLVEEVRRHAGAKTLTDCLLIALREWTARRRIRELNQRVQEKPLRFVDGLDAEMLRSLNQEAYTRAA